MRAVVVTGANGGVGRPVVQRLSERGFTVLCAVRRLESAAGLEGQAVVLDVTDPESIAAARDEVAAHVGADGLYGLVNNAGLSVDGPLELISADALARQFAVNTIGPVAVTQAFLPLLRAARGRVVNIGGAAGTTALPMFGALSASKAALDSLSDALRMELRHQGVSVSYVEPGGLQTEFFVTAEEARPGDTRDASAEARSIYSAATDALWAKLAEASASPVAVAVDAIESALTDRRPAARYRVGRDARYVLPMLRRLPTGVRDRLVMANLGLKAEAFSP